MRMNKKGRIRKNLEFRRVYRRGKSYSNALLVLYIFKNSMNIDYSRVGISVSKKVGNSVVRSRVKRLISESYRLNKQNLKTGYDLVFVARSAIKDKSYSEVESSVINLLKRAGLYNKYENNIN